MVLQSVQVLQYKGPEMLVERRSFWPLREMKPFHPSVDSLQRCYFHRQPWT